MAEKIPIQWSAEGSNSSDSLNEEHIEALLPNTPRGLFTRRVVGGGNCAIEASIDEDDQSPPARPSDVRYIHYVEAGRVSRDIEASLSNASRNRFTRRVGDGGNCAIEASIDEDDQSPPRPSHSRYIHHVEAGRVHSRDIEASFSNPSTGSFTRAMGDGCNYAYEASPDDEDDIPPPTRPSPSDFYYVEAGRVHSQDEADARAEFMAVSRPREYLRSMSDGFYVESENQHKKTYISMSPLSSGNRQAASISFLDETSRDMEAAEAMMSGASASEIVSRRVLAPNRYETSRTSNPRISSQSQASSSRGSVDPLESVRSSTLSNATTVSDEQRKNRVTITPLLDEYYRNRPTAIIADNPALSDMDNLVDNDAQGDSGSQNPPENPQGEGAEAPEEDGWTEMYYKLSKLIISSPFLLIIYIPLALWSLFCIYNGMKYMKRCPATDTLPMIFVFLGLTSLFACITRIVHIVTHKLQAYPSIATIVQCLQAVMFLGYFFVYILELSSFFLLDLKSLTENCATEYYYFTRWNTWLQLPVMIIMIILHAPSAYRSKWYCGRAS